MAVTIPRRRFPETLVFLSFLIPLMLLTPQSHAAVPTASSDYEMTTSIKVVINKGDTYDMTIVGQRKSRSSSVKEAMQDACDESEVSGILEADGTPFQVVQQINRRRFPQLIGKKCGDGQLPLCPGRENPGDAPQIGRTGGERLSSSIGPELHTADLS